VWLALELSRHLGNRRDSAEVDHAGIENFHHDKVLTTLRIFAFRHNVINSDVYPPIVLDPFKNLKLHFSHQYLPAQSVEQDFFNKNSFFIKR
jgi:hypothetical protein